MLDALPCRVLQCNTTQNISELSIMKTMDLPRFRNHKKNEGDLNLEGELTQRFFNGFHIYYIL